VRCEVLSIFHWPCIIADVAIVQQLCKYPDKTKARIGRLSSDEAALSNVPYSRTPIVSDTGSMSGISADLRQRVPQERTSFGAQKRRSSAEDAEGSGIAPTKKPKTASVPMLG
jgi:hypothetical protein